MAKNKKKKPADGLKHYTKFFVTPPDPKGSRPDLHTGLIPQYAKRHQDWGLDADGWLDLHVRLTEQQLLFAIQKFEQANGPIARMDRIDLSGCTRPPPTDYPGDWGPGHILRSLFAYVPCYDDGILDIGSGRSYYFKILSVDPEKQETKVFVQLFSLIELNSGMKSYNPGPRCVFNLILHPDENPPITISYREEDVGSLVRIVTEITPKELGWTAREADYWQKVIVRHTVNMCAEAEAQADGPDDSLMAEMGQQFFRHVAMANAILEDGKLKAVRPTGPSVTRPKPGNPAHMDARSPSKPYDPDERIVRTCGSARFVSDKPPRRPSQLPRRYVVPSWTVRGHTRTYKSGKTVYIKPAVKHRKGLESAPTRPSTLKIAGPEDPGPPA